MPLRSPSFVSKVGGLRGSKRVNRAVQSALDIGQSMAWGVGRAAGEGQALLGGVCLFLGQERGDSPSDLEALEGPGYL